MTGESAYQRILDRLRTHNRRVVEQGPDHAKASCPVPGHNHDDRDPSLSIRRLPQRAKLKCFGQGHSDEAVLAAIGLQVRDLFDNRKGAEYPYADGRTAHRSWQKKFWQTGPKTNGQQTSLYELSKVKAAVAARRLIYLVEGEQDADAINSLPEEERGGAVATTARGDADNFHLCDVGPLRGAQVAAIVDKPVKDGDTSGENWARQVEAGLRPIAESLDYLEAREGKDALDHIMAGYGLDEMVERHDPERPKPEPRRTDWWLVDLGPVLAGKWKRPEPTVGQRNDGHGLFYPGKSHTIAAETEAGKTWLALAISWEEMLAGSHVLFIDFEDDEGTIVDRLRTIMPREELFKHGYGEVLIRDHFHYLRPESDIRSKAKVQDLAEIMHTFRPTVAFNDGITEAMALHNLNPLDNSDIATFNAILVKPLLSFGTAVASLDHVVKDKEGRGRYALGGVHKLNGVSGAGYLLESVTPFGVGMTGRSRLLISKDRVGQLRANGLPSANGSLYTYGDLVLTSHSRDSATVKIWPPKGRESESPTSIPVTEYMKRVADFLAPRKDGVPSKELIETGVEGKAVAVREALNHMILDGYVTDGRPYKLIKKYPPDPEKRG